MPETHGRRPAFLSGATDPLEELTLTTREERFEALYSEYRDQIFAYALRRVPPDVAQDITAETFAIAWRRLDKVPVKEPAGWLFTTARNVLAARRRGELRQGQIAARLEPEAARRGEETDDPVSVRPILAALSALTEQEREVLLLAAWEGLDSTQGAAALGCSRTAFRIRLHRARRRLQQVLDQMDRPSPSMRRATSQVQMKENY